MYSTVHLYEYSIQESQPPTNPCVPPPHVQANNQPSNPLPTPNFLQLLRPDIRTQRLLAALDGPVLPSPIRTDMSTPCAGQQKKVIARKARSSKRGNLNIWPSSDRKTADTAFRHLVAEGLAKEFQPPSSWEVCPGTAHLDQHPQVHRHILVLIGTNSFTQTKLRHHARDPAFQGRVGIEEFHSKIYTHINTRFFGIVSALNDNRPVPPPSKTLPQLLCGSDPASTQPLPSPASPSPPTNEPAKEPAAPTPPPTSTDNHTTSTTNKKRLRSPSPSPDNSAPPAQKRPHLPAVILLPSPPSSTTPFPQPGKHPLSRTHTPPTLLAPAPAPPPSPSPPRQPFSLQLSPEA